MRIRANSFLGVKGLSHLCPKNISTIPEKTVTLTSEITLPDSSYPIIRPIGKSTGLWALHLAGWNEFIFFV